MTPARLQPPPWPLSPARPPPPVGPVEGEGLPTGSRGASQGRGRERGQPLTEDPCPMGTTTLHRDLRKDLGGTSC